MIPLVTVDLLSRAQTMEGGLKQSIDDDQIPRPYYATSSAEDPM